jgi:hypothetical protein
MSDLQASRFNSSIHADLTANFSFYIQKFTRFAIVQGSPFVSRAQCPRFADTTKKLKLGRLDAFGFYIGKSNLQANEQPSQCAGQLGIANETFSHAYWRPGTRRPAMSSRLHRATLSFTDSPSDSVTRTVTGLSLVFPRISSFVICHSVIFQGLKILG